jgi:hypothetical protein
MGGCRFLVVLPYPNTGFLDKVDGMAVSGHQDIYGGDEGLRHHLCLHHGEHLDEGASHEHMEDLHNDEHGYNPGHRGEYSCPEWEHTEEDEPTEFHDMHERNNGIGEVHRGIGVSLPDDLHRMVHDQSRPVHERARALLEHVSDHPEGQGHLGTHWTTENGVAEDFAETAAKWKRDEDDRDRPDHDFSFGHHDEEWEGETERARMPKPGTAVVFHAYEPHPDVIDRDPHRWGNGDVYGYSEHGEREVPVRSSHDLDLRGISWAQVHSDDDPRSYGLPEYEHHDFGHGHTASAQGDDHSTDWDRVFREKDPRLTEVHRGMRLWPDYDAYEHAHDQSRPVHERAHALLGHIGDLMKREGRGIGMSWTDSPAMARQVAGEGGWSPHGLTGRPDSGDADYDDRPFHMPVVLNAAWPGKEHIETRPHVLKDHGVFPYDDPETSQGEVPVREGAPVKITGISWAKDGTERDTWNHHTFDHPVHYNGTEFEHHEPGQDHTAALLGHFEAAAMIDLYHHTSPENAAEITRSRSMHDLRHQQGDVFFSTVRNGFYGGDYGPAAVHVRVPPELATLNDSFRNGEKFYTVRASDLRPEHFVDPEITREASSPEEYGMSHRPDEAGPPLHDLNEGDMMPRDIYDRMHEYDLYSHDTGLLGEASYQAQRKARLFRGKPDKLVTIWRSAPAVNPESRNAKRGEINHGDWVGLSRHKALAESYEVNDPSRGSLPANHPDRYHVWSARVPARHVRNADGDLTEWGYFGPDVKDIPHVSEQCSHRARVKPREAAAQEPPGNEVVAHFEDPGPRPFTATAQEGGEYGPKPEWQRAPEGLSDEDRSADFDRQMGVKHAWDAKILHGMSTGQLPAHRAKELGYYFNGDQTDRNNDPKWRPLPEHLYHVTTDLPGVREHGLKTRRELGQMQGHGLGGGPDDTISLAADHGQARDILRAVHEFHHVVNGRYTPAQMWEDAKAGNGAPRPFHEDLASYHQSGWKEGNPLPRGLDSAVRGVETKAGGLLYSPQEMAEHHGPGWRPHAHESDEFTSPDGKTRYNVWERDLDADGRREHAADFYKNFAAYREHAGGHSNPLFFSTDTKAFAAKDPKDFAIVHLRPRPGGHGYPLEGGALSEWRTGSGDALEAHRAERLEDGHLKEAAVSKFAALENPHTHGHDWYHGSPYRFGDFGDDSPQSGLEFQDEPEDTTHWNTLLGHHFSASHGMAEEFSKGEHSAGGHGEEGPAQNVVHARLELKNPKVYASEHDMDQDAYEREWKAGNHHDQYHDPDELAEAKENGWDDVPSWEYTGHSDRVRSKDEADPMYWRQNRQFHPYATGWLNTHPDKYSIAQRFRQHLEGQGHDGIVYGNEFEKHHDTADQHHVCAIPFHEGQIDVTQRHTGPACVDPESARRQWPGRSQPMLPGFGEHEGAFEVVAHFEEPRTAAGPYMQQKLFHMQPDPTLNGPESGRHNPADPEGHLRWRHEHDEGYEPDTCEQCGEDQRRWREHAEKHDDWQRGQDWYTDWSEEHPGAVIHRGIGVALPPEVHSVVHDESRPLAERARALAHHVTSGSGLGNFWSSDPDVSKTYAESSAKRYSSQGEQTPVMLHARTPETEHIETDPETLQHWGVYSYHLAGNREVPLTHGAPVHLKGISWAPPGHEAQGPHHSSVAWHTPGSHRFDQDPAWTHHEFDGEGIQANASLAAAVAHFEEGPLPEYHGEPLYHGTRSVLDPGEHLTVEEAERHPNNPDIQTDPYVHATTDPREAHHWGERANAYQAQHRMTEMGRERRIGPGENAAHAYRPRVYEVHPTGHVEPDLEYADTEHDSWRSAHPMRVKREVEPITCYDCPDTGGNEEHWPDHPHYEYLRQQADEDEADRVERGHTAALDAVAHFEDDDEDPDDYSANDEWDEDTPPEHEDDEPEEEPVAHRNYRLPYMTKPPEGELIDHLHHHHGLDARTSDLYMNAKDRDRWHASEHQYKTNSTHQHEHPQGTPGEEHWPDVFELSEHTDFPGGTRGDWSRVPGHTAPFKPLRTSESVSLPEVTAPPSFVHRYQSPGPEGYEDREQTVSGPFYHGSRSKRLRPGSQVRVGMPTNGWGDEGERSQYVHFTTDLGAAREYSARAGGHVYEVEPTGEVRGGYNGSEWKSEHPLRVIRRVEGEELPPVTAAVVAHFEDDDHDYGDEGYDSASDLEPAGHERDEHDFIHPMVRDRESGERYPSPFEEPRCLNCERATGAEQRHRPEDGHPVPGVQGHLDRKREQEDRWDQGKYDRTRYCGVQCEMSHAEDRERGISVHHTFQVGEREDAAPVDHEGLPSLSGPFDEPVGRDSRYEVRNPSAEHRCHYCRNILPQYRKEASVTAAYDWNTDEGPYTWDEIGARHPHAYGEDSGNSEGIGWAANHLAFDHPGDPDAESHDVSELEFHPRTVEPSRIDYQRSEPGDSRVARARKGYEGQQPEKVPPLILVHRHGVFQVADGHHRAEGADKARKPVRAYVAYSPHEDESFSDGERAPYHGASTEEPRAYTDSSTGRPFRMSYPGFPHTADVPRPQSHEASRHKEVTLIPVYDTAAAIEEVPRTVCPRVDAVVDAIGLLGAWVPRDARDAAEGVIALRAVFEALWGGLGHVAGVIDEMPVSNDVAEGLWEMARAARTASEDCERTAPRLPPEASCEESSPPNR